MRLLPREEKFYQLFKEQAKIILQAAKWLLDGVRAGGPAMGTAAAEIGALEHQGDEVTQQVVTRLHQTFITPIDPEDIHSISSALDDVLDGIEDTSHRLISYRIDPIPPTMATLAEILAHCAQSLDSAFAALEKNKSVAEECREIKRLESEADAIGRRTISDLFDNEKDSVKLFKLKEIYEFIEETIDHCEDVADVLQNVAVKNS
jgi:predicted phosphate transport protein (TIGR00153 family)